MNDSLMKQLEEATGIAFKEFRAKHPALAQEIEYAVMLDALIQSINSDPKALAALEEAAAAKSRLGAISQLVEVVKEKLPSVLSKFGI